MRTLKLHNVLIIFFLLSDFVLIGQNIQKFEHFNSEDGLSQNTVFSIHCDKKGFLWIGTWNGLNRYDGHEFKTFNNPTRADEEHFTNNRIIKIWEDSLEMIWMETYDHYYHYFNPKTESIETFPVYSSKPEEKNSIGTCFLQYNDSTVIIGTTNSGIYLLEYNKKKLSYSTKQFLNKGANSLTNNNITFIHTDKDKNLWIGTEHGINFLPSKDFSNRNYKFQHLYLNVSFSNSAVENDKTIWFGSNNHGILSYNKKSEKFEYINRLSSAQIPSGRINQLLAPNSEIIIASFENNGLYLYNSNENSWREIPFHGKTTTQIYVDRFNQAWITAREFGLTKLNLLTLSTKYYQLTPKESEYITDLERPVFFEDSNDQLWIGLHGSGLAFYDRHNDKFTFYKNNPKDTKTIGSNIVHCINEDNMGQMWIGTGQYKGGLEKVVFSNPAIIHKIPEPYYTSLFTNVVRALCEDSNGNIWVASKSGKIHIYNKNYQLITVKKLYSESNKSYRGNNVYSILQAKDGYVWLGSKGEGLGRSKVPIKTGCDYSKIDFIWYTHHENDEKSLGSNNIYSIAEDKNSNLWIGTYGNGISLLKAGKINKPEFITFNTKNSNISSNAIRHIHIDSNENIWAASVFGVNFLHRDSVSNKAFISYLHSQKNLKSISYNDIIHIYEDSHNNIWFSTFGSGVNVVKDFSHPSKIEFQRITSSDGLSNNVVFGILEDNDGKIWFSSEHGLSSYSHDESNFVTYTENNGLNFNNFSENTCIKTSNGNLIFGGNLGFIAISTDKLSNIDLNGSVELTDFLLFNEKVKPQTKDSPLKLGIAYTNEITLKPNQSSFSIVFSSLDFIDPGNVQYAYILENFDSDWNYIGTQSKATYTKLPYGSYTFKVKSSNRNGQWNNKDIRILKIKILAPWYRTTLAYIIFSFVFIVAFYIAYQIRSKINSYKQDLLIEKKVNSVKLQFFTNISHEIRTPLTLIIGPIEDLIFNNELPAKAINKLKIIQKNAKRMLRLTNQLLDFRKVQNNKMNLKIKEMNIISFALDIYKSFEPLALHKGINYQFKSEFNELNIWADPTQLDIIIYNLLSNALKFTNENKKVELSINKNQQLNQIEISIIDEGKGISPENLTELFSRYTILSNHELSGTGIGLSLSYELAKLHGGDIRVNSLINKGSTFTLVIPEGYKHLQKKKHIQFVDSNTINSKVKHESIMDFNVESNLTENESNTKSKQIAIVVEDNREILDYVCQALQPEFTCMQATNGEEALHLLEENNADVIVTDIMMPIMDGIELTKRVKTKFETSHIPVVMLTAKTDINDQIEGIEIGAEAYIKKPFNTTHLKSVVVNLITQRKNILNHIKSSEQIISPNTLNINSKDEDFLKKLVNYVEENHAKEITIDQLAEYCCLSRTVFYNKVKSLTGHSPIEFLRELKLKIAAQLLEKGYNVSEVAFQIGFNDVKYFSRQFKSLFGYPPSKHLQMINKEDQKHD